VVHGSHLFQGSLKHVPLTEGLRHRLNLIRDLELPDVEERLSLLKHLLLHEFLHLLNLSLLSIVDQVGESLLVDDALHSGDLPLRAHSHLRHPVRLFLHVGDDVFNDFLHEDAVVTFSSHARVRTENSFGDLGATEV